MCLNRTKVLFHAQHVLEVFCWEEGMLHTDAKRYLVLLDEMRGVREKQKERYLTPWDENGLLFSVEGTDSQYL